MPGFAGGFQVSLADLNLETCSLTAMPKEAS